MKRILDILMWVESQKTVRVLFTISNSGVNSPKIVQHIQCLQIQLEMLTNKEPLFKDLGFD